MWRCVTKELFVSPCMQHVMCGIPTIELHQDRAIYKVGAPRKACYRISKAFHDTMIFLGNTTKVSTFPLKLLQDVTELTVAISLHTSSGMPIHPPIPFTLASISVRATNLNNSTLMHLYLDFYPCACSKILHACN